MDSLSRFVPEKWWRLVDRVVEESQQPLISLNGSMIHRIRTLEYKGFFVRDLTFQCGSGIKLHGCYFGRKWTVPCCPDFFLALDLQVLSFQTLMKKQLARQANASMISSCRFQMDLPRMWVGLFVAATGVSLLLCD